MSKIAIDYRNTDAKPEVCKLLDEWIASPKKEKLEIQLEHVVSGDFEEDFDIGDVTDFNGWQCDWWHHMTYKNHVFHLFGEAWYGRILITN